jgi:nitrate reductase NapE component
MATIVNEGAERRTYPRRANDRTGMALRETAVAPAVAVSDTDGMRVSWGGIWGGVLVGMGILMLLTALGLAVGATAVDPRETEARELGIGAAVWAGLTLLLALYIAGHVSTRIGAIFDRTTSTYEGFLVWVLSVLFMAFFAASGIGLVAAGAFKLVGGATQAIGTVVSGGSSTDLGEGNVDQIVQRLKDPQTAHVLAGATGMQEDQVRQNLSQMADKAQAAKDDPARAAAEVRQGVQQMIQQAREDGTFQRAAERAQAAAKKTAWITFLALVLSLFAALLGAWSGRRGAALTAGREA